MKYNWVGCAVAGLWVAVMGGMSGALAVEALAVRPPMLSHRAMYSVSLSPDHNRGQVSNVDGRMVTEWQETCDGLISEQRIVTDMLDEAGEKSLSDISASSWESQDGLRFRFSMRQRLDNKLVAEYVGNAVYPAELGQGTATISKPDEKVVVLPAGVLFPSGYMQALLDAARNGKKSMSRQVFDGTSESDYYLVVTAIGSETTGNAAQQSEETRNDKVHKSVVSAVEGLSWWPVQVSYYGLEVNEGLPEFEMAFKLYDNGISADLTLDYGAFALFASLQRVEAYKRPDC